MGLITEVKVRVSPLPEKETFHVVFLPDWQAGVDAMRTLAQARVALSMLRLSNVVETMTLMYSGDSAQADALNETLKAQGLGDDKVMLTFGVSTTLDQHAGVLNQALAVIKDIGGVDAGEEMGAHWAKGRFAAPYLRETLWTAGYAVDTMETAVNWDKVNVTVNEMESSIRSALVDAEAGLNEKVHVYTHLSHVYGQGCSVYTTYLFRCAVSYEKTYQYWCRLKAAGAGAIVRQGGTISHQHGVGRDHREYLPAEKGGLGISAIRALCHTFDPEQRMNPGKLLLDEQ
jgi:alkyldihydroxyacetonephosphate synthase